MAAVVRSLFSSIPVEILLRIVDFLPTPTFAAMRLTCRSIELALFHPFVSEYFSKRQFMLTTFSLKALVGIASCPRLSSHLRHVIIGLDMIISNRPALKGASDPAADQALLLKSGDASELLYQAFSRLKGLEVIELRDYASNTRWRDGSSWTSYGTVTFNLEFSPYQGPTSQYSLSFRQSSTTSCTDILLQVMRALSRAGSQLSRLELNLRRVDQALEPRYYTTYAALDGHYASIVALTPQVFLKIQLRHLDDWPYLCDLISRLKSVRHLRLNIYSLSGPLDSSFLHWFGAQSDDQVPIQPDEHRIQPPPIVRADMVPLTQLDFGGLACSPSLLLKVLTKFASSLQGISLYRVRLYGVLPGKKSSMKTWNKFLCDLVKIPGFLHLRHLVIWGAFSDRNLAVSPAHSGVNDNEVYFEYDGPAWRPSLVQLCTDLQQRIQAPAVVERSDYDWLAQIPEFELYYNSDDDVDDYDDSSNSGSP